MYEKRCPNETDAAFFIASMKDIDREKALIVSDDVSESSLQDMIDSSDYCMVLDADGVPFCIYGAIPDNQGGAITWALTTDALYCHKKYFLSVSYREFEVLKHRYNCLYNYGYANHPKSIEWGVLLGYEPQFETTINGKKFIFMKWQR